MTPNLYSIGVRSSSHVLDVDAISLHQPVATTGLVTREIRGCCQVDATLSLQFLEDLVTKQMA